MQPISDSQKPASKLSEINQSGRLLLMVPIINSLCLKKIEKSLSKNRKNGNLSRDMHQLSNRVCYYNRLGFSAIMLTIIGLAALKLIGQGEISGSQASLLGFAGLVSIVNLIYIEMVGQRAFVDDICRF